MRARAQLEHTSSSTKVRQRSLRELPFMSSTDLIASMARSTSSCDAAGLSSSRTSAGSPWQATNICSVRTERVQSRCVKRAASCRVVCEELGRERREERRDEM